jgi:hypothetical protein
VDLSPAFEAVCYCLGQSKILTSVCPSMNAFIPSFFSNVQIAPLDFRINHPTSFSRFSYSKCFIHQSSIPRRAIFLEYGLLAKTPAKRDVSDSCVLNIRNFSFSSVSALFL